MKYFFKYILYFGFTSVFAQQPNLLFAKGLGGAGGDWGNSIAVDVNNNIYVAGEFNSTADFDPSASSSIITSAGLSDLFFAKYDVNGNYVWAKSIGTTGRETVNSIAVDKLGNSYITGYFEGSADFDPGVGVATLSPIGSGRDFFFAKYDVLGNYLWAKSLGGGNTDIGNSLTLDSIGNLYITGYFSQTLDFDPGPGTATLSGVSQGIFFAKYDTNGNYVWANSLHSTGWNKGNSIKADKIGNVYITGFFSSTIDFDPGSGITNLNGGSQSIYFAKYTNSGGYLWANKIGVSSYDNSYEIALDESNNVLITGVFAGTQDFDPGIDSSKLTAVGFGDIFFAKYDSFGNYLWAKNIGTGGWEESYSIATDKNSDIYISGYFSNTIDLDPGIGVATHTSSGAPQIFLAKYDNSGNHIWSESFGATNNDQGQHITLDNNGNLYLVGEFTETVDFSTGAVATNLTSNSSSLDVFFAKYSSTSVGLKNYLMMGNISLYPNPNTGDFNLFIDRDIDNVEIEIINTLGQKLFTQKLFKGTNYIEAKNLKEGLYFYTIIQNHYVMHTDKIIIEK